MRVARTATATGIAGLSLIEEFITEAEEQCLIHYVDSAGVWEPLAKRRVQHYGYAFDYKTRGVNVRSRLGPLPDAFGPLAAKLSRLEEINRKLDQLTVNEYVPGVGLSPHVDTHSMFADAIASVTLCGHTVMEFRRDDESKALLLPRRSALIMTEDARYAWKHYIPHRKTDPLDDMEDDEAVRTRRPARRVSLTFRSVRGHPCTCSFPEECDTVLEQRVLTTPEVEKIYVQQMYNAIAPHFSSTRFSRWPKVVEFLSTIRAGSIVADAGCGNGKYLGVRKDCLMLASDASQELAHDCQRSGYDAAVADILGLPYRDSTCDAVICIAVVHHLSSLARRQRAIAELARVLRRGGRGLVTAWAMEQERPERTIQKWEQIDRGKQDDFFVPWHLPSHRTGRQHQQDPNAVARTTSEDEFRVYKRYYHMFREGELADLVDSVPGARTVAQFFDKSNWCVVFESTAGERTTDS